MIVESTSFMNVTRFSSFISNLRMRTTTIHETLDDYTRTSVVQIPVAHCVTAGCGRQQCPLPASTFSYEGRGSPTRPRCFAKALITASFISSVNTEFICVMYSQRKWPKSGQRSAIALMSQAGGRGSLSCSSRGPG